MLGLTIVAVHQRLLLFITFALLVCQGVLLLLLCTSNLLGVLFDVKKLQTDKMLLQGLIRVKVSHFRVKFKVV